MRKVYKILYQRWFMVIFTISIHQVAIAQNSFKASMLMGVNFSQIDGDKMGGFNKAGFRLGLQVNREFKKNFRYYIELAYTQKGSRRIYNEDGPIGGIWDRARTDYIEVPLMIGWTGKKKLEYMAGISGGFLVRKSVYDYNYGYSPSGFFRKGEFCFLGGVNYPLNTNWSAGLRYQQSVLSVAKSGIPIWSTYTNFMIHKVLLFQLSYHLNE